LSETCLVDHVRGRGRAGQSGSARPASAASRGTWSSTRMSWVFRNPGFPSSSRELKGPQRELRVSKGNSPMSSLGLLKNSGRLPDVPMWRAAGRFWCRVPRPGAVGQTRRPGPCWAGCRSGAWDCFAHVALLQRLASRPVSGHVLGVVTGPAGYRRCCSTRPGPGWSCTSSLLMSGW